MMNIGDRFDWILAVSDQSWYIEAQMLEIIKACRLD